MKIGNPIRNTMMLLSLFWTFASTAALSEVLAVKKVATFPLGINPSVTSFYARSAADENTAFFTENVGLNLGLSAPLGDFGTIGLETGVSRDIDALEMRNVWSSTTLSYYSQSHKILKDYDLRYGFNATLPTNSDTREFLSYRGSLGTNVSFGRTLELKIGPVLDQIKLGFGAEAVRNFFEFDSTKAGKPNKTLNLSQNVNASVRLFEIVTASGGYVWIKGLRANSSWTDPTYALNLGLSGTIGEHLTLSLTQKNEDRALSYDYQTAKIALYDEQATVYTASAAYKF